MILQNNGGNLAWEEAKQIAKSQNVEIDKSRYSTWHNGDAKHIWVSFFIKTDTGWNSKSIEITMTQNEDGTYKVKNDSQFVIVPPETNGEVYDSVISKLREVSSILHLIRYKEKSFP